MEYVIEAGTPPDSPGGRNATPLREAVRRLGVGQMIRVPDRHPKSVSACGRNVRMETGRSRRFVVRTVDGVPCIYRIA